jgi:hypothetical protein
LTGGWTGSETTAGSFQKQDSDAGLQRRVETLQIGIVGVNDNGKTNSDTISNHIVGNLSERYSLEEVVTIKKHSVSHAIKDDAPRMLAQKCKLLFKSK